jgi:hypothetical protein
MRLTAIEPRFVEFIPAELEPGTLYVSMAYATTTHLCACGCGNKVVLPLSPAEWQLHFDGESASLTPSIGNWEFPCRSHYWIKANKIRWAARWTDDQVNAGRQHDAEALDAYLGSTSRTGAPRGDQPAPLRDRIRRKIHRWLRR